jgi:uncharacterized membrane protein YdbT with pleckstrin-like domain
MAVLNDHHDLTWLRMPDQPQRRFVMKEEEVHASNAIIVSQPVATALAAAAAVSSTQMHGLRALFSPSFVYLTVAAVAVLIVLYLVYLLLTRIRHVDSQTKRDPNFKTTAQLIDQLDRSVSGTLDRSSVN